MGVGGRSHVERLDSKEVNISKLAFVFPGQGSQFVGMAQDLFDEFDSVRQTYEQANEILGFDLAEICFQGPEEELKQTRVTQPAIFVHSAILTRFLADKNIKPAMTAGHSLGEYSALHAAEALTFDDALKLVKIRAELMQKAGEISEGTMAAIIGLPPDQVVEVCENASSAGVVQVANINSRNQVVISGSVAGVEKGMEVAKEKGARRVVRLVVGGAFHSSLMEYASEGLQQALQGINIQPARVPIYSNVHAKPVSQPDEIRQYLVQQLTSPVRWLEIIENMVQDGASDFYEIGPGSVLTGLLKRTNKEVVARAIGTKSDLDVN